jgi:hypothetical protein
MIKKHSPSIRILYALIVSTMFAGCFTVMSDLSTDAADYVDLSDPSADTAQLKAARWDIGIAGVYCRMTAPANAERITVNAGTVDVSVECETTDIGSESGRLLDTVSFSFNALAAHEYVITKRDCQGCVNLKDQSAGEIVAEYPTKRCLEKQRIVKMIDESGKTRQVWGVSCE